MSEIESLVSTALIRLAVAVDVITACLIAFAVVEAAVRTMRLSLAAFSGTGGGQEAIRLRLGKWLALALEFALASDLVRTAVAPTWDEIGKLAAIVVLRTALNYFLEREFERSAEMRAEPVRAVA